jgi:hypothetical protein
MSVDINGPTVYRNKIHMPTLNDLSTGQLREALQLSEQIDSLQQKLTALLGGTGSATKAAPSVASVASVATRTRKGMSPATRAKMRAAQQARWAKIKGSSPSAAAPAATSKPKRGLTPEGRAKLAAAMKARWAARKKGAPAPNAASH